MWPSQNVASLNAFYGNPVGPYGGEDPTWKAENLVAVPVPYRMVLAWDDSVLVNKIWFHRKCANSLWRALIGIAILYPTQEEIEASHLHLFGGSFSYRRIAGSHRLSCHSWGIAIDIDPEGNPLGAIHGRIPQSVVQSFKDEGAEWGGQWHHRKDLMHFQWAHT